MTEYVRYMRRISILQEYAPTKEEELLYNKVSEYLLSPKLYALPASQRKLMTLILRKLLASSSFAISGTLQALIARLQHMLEGYGTELDIDDYDVLPEIIEEWDDEKNEDFAEMLKDTREISEELQKLTEFLELAQSIKFNAKGENLLIALQKGFEKSAELGAQGKAVIFTESKRTQDYLVNLLTNNGYDGQVVVLNGYNNDSNSKRIYNEWLARHQGEDVISGSKQADMKAAIVEEFRERASILIGTEGLRITEVVMMSRKQKLELTWIGKYDEIKVEPRILLEDKSKGYGDPNTENMLIHGDNLLALKALEQDFAGKIKCIYSVYILILHIILEVLLRIMTIIWNTQSGLI